MTLREALTGSWRFWALAVAFFLGIIVLNGTLTQVVPMLKDRGVRLEAATTVLAYTGIAAMAGGVLSGWLLDRFHGVLCRHRVLRDADDRTSRCSSADWGSRRRSPARCCAASPTAPRST